VRCSGSTRGGALLSIKTRVRNWRIQPPIDAIFGANGRTCRGAFATSRFAQVEHQSRTRLRNAPRNERQEAHRVLVSCRIVVQAEPITMLRRHGSRDRSLGISNRSDFGVRSGAFETHRCSHESPSRGRSVSPGICTFYTVVIYVIRSSTRFFRDDTVALLDNRRPKPTKDRWDIAIAKRNRNRELRVASRQLHARSFNSSPFL